MVIISKAIIREFIELYGDAESSCITGMKLRPMPTGKISMK
jgi:hypothetical protein